MQRTLKRELKDLKLLKGKGLALVAGLVADHMSGRMLLGSIKNTDHLMEGRGSSRRASQARARHTAISQVSMNWGRRTRDLGSP